MGSNSRKNSNDDCFKDLKNDLCKLIKNFKRNRCNCGRVKKNSGIKNALKWAAIGAILTLLIMSQIGIPLAFILIAIIAIAIICSKL
ncbi:hypothetical protein QYB59_000903 [Clostridium perfringens]|nr:hypothetical protein [Clostridium perfringens]